MELPRQLTPFIGREEELAEISALLADQDCRLLTIVGTGGVGKTRLAIQVAALVAHRFANGVQFVPLQVIPSSHQLATKLADELRLSLSGQDSPEEQLIRFLRNKETLLVLDNFEHLLDQASLLSELLSEAPRIKIVVTSREILNLQEEWLYRVAGLKTPSASAGAESEAFDAVHFFVGRIRRVNSRISVHDELGAIINICNLVEGTPLALELAASWGGTMSCAEIASEIQQNLSFLTSGLRNLPDRHRSMRAVFEQTWKRLSAEEQEVLKQLSVFRGTFRRQAAEAVAGADLATLSSLVNKSLLQWDARGRYHLHELVRQFAEELLMDSPLGAGVRDRHTLYFANFLQRRLADIHAGRQVDAMNEMEAELDNLRSAWHWAATHGKVDEIRKALLALVWLWQYQSHYQEAAESLEMAIRSLEVGTRSGKASVALAELLAQYGWICIRLGQIERAEEMLEKAQSLYEQLQVAPISDGGSDPLSVLAMVAILRGDFQTGIELLEVARTRQEARGDRRNLATTCYVLTSALLGQGDYTRAEECARRAHRLAQEVNDQWSVSYTLTDLGRVTSLLGHFEEARQHYRASYAIRRQYRDREGMAVALRRLGEIALRQLEVDEAQRLFRESVDLYEGTGDIGGLAAALEGLGNTLCLQGRYEEARHVLLRALQIAARIGILPLTFSIFVSVSGYLLHIGQLKPAVTTLAFVQNHPAAPSEIKMQAGNLLEGHATQLPSERPTDTYSTDVESRTLDLQAWLATSMIHHATSPPAANDTEFDPNQLLIEPLTPRELDVLRLMADGLSNQQIAEHLIVALGTVKSYTSRIYSKLGVQNRIQAVEQAKKLTLL